MLSLFFLSKKVILEKKFYFDRFKFMNIIKYRVFFFNLSFCLQFTFVIKLYPGHVTHYIKVNLKRIFLVYYLFIYIFYFKNKIRY